MKNKSAKAEAGTKAKITDCSFRLFAKKGIKDISMREIAQASGVTKPVIYYYFKDKDALCFEIIRNFTEVEDSRLLALWRTSAGLGAFLEQFFASHVDNPKHKKMVGFMLHMHSYLTSRPEMEARFKQFHCGRTDILKDILAEEVSAGRIKAGMVFTAHNLIISVIKHTVLNAKKPVVKFPRSYPVDITKAILRAIEYKGEKK
jgi:AcrR family transcriptional regulator